MPAVDARRRCGVLGGGTFNDARVRETIAPRDRAPTPSSGTDLTRSRRWTNYTTPTAAVRNTTSCRGGSSSARRRACRRRRSFPAWLPKIVMAKSYASTRDIIVSVFMRGGADGLSLCVPFADRELLHVAHDDRDSAPRFVGRDERHQSRRLLHVPAGDGRARCRRSRRRICSSCTRTGQLNVNSRRTSTRSASWKSASRSIRRSSPGGLAGIWRAFRRSSPTRRCAASASRTDLQKTLVARRRHAVPTRRCRSPIRPTTRSAARRRRRRSASRSCRPTTPPPTSRCTPRRSTRRTR